MYRRNEESIFKSIDWITVSIYLILVFCGWLCIYGASYHPDHAKSIFDTSGRAGMQLVWIGTSIILAFVILKIDSNLYDVLGYHIYIVFILLLLVTIVVAPDIKGSRSWLVITNTIRLQPAEFAKFAVALALARFINSYNLKLVRFKNIAIVAGIIFLPIILIIAQRETGSALVYIAFILMLYREGLPGILLGIFASAILLFIIGLKYSATYVGFLTTGEFISILIIIVISILMLIIYKKDKKKARNILLGTIVLLVITYLLSLHTKITIGLGAIIAIIGSFIYLIICSIKSWSKVYLLIGIFLLVGTVYMYSINYIFNDIMEPHQQTRIKVALGMKEDLKGAGYNVNQSKIAIGSGGFIGKGFLKGTQTKLKYVPEQDTDFIFCTIGEEQGFIGSVVVLIIFLILLLRIIYLSENQKSTFSRVYGYCIAAIILFHVAINVGMVIGITPVIGIPLPFFSYGGSSLWGFTILLFIFLRLDMANKTKF